MSSPHCIKSAIYVLGIIAVCMEGAPHACAASEEFLRIQPSPSCREFENLRIQSLACSCTLPQKIGMYNSSREGQVRSLWFRRHALPGGDRCREAPGVEGQAGA